MSNDFKPIRDWPHQSAFKAGDYLVVIGEVFSRGYVNGLIDEAKKHGMKVILTTVGRREKSNDPHSSEKLRPLSVEEASHFSDPFINVPLEAGFDLAAAKDGSTPVDQLKDAKLKDWEKIKLDWDRIEQSRKSGEISFRGRLSQALEAIDELVPAGASILFAHTMAGGFPRARVIMPIANHVFKGFGDRYSASEVFWGTDLGRFCKQSFHEVTGQTFEHLIDLTTEIRARREKSGASVAYVAYGYHGTEVYNGSKFAWQAYSPYLQGWAKLHLENIAKKYHQKDIQCSVYNCPEILTQSTTIFLGVEVSLYPLLEPLKGNKQVVKACSDLLKPGHSIEEILAVTSNYLSSDIIKEWSQFKDWPKHNGPEQMEMMRTTSDKLINFHQDTKTLLTAVLSEYVFRACGKIMLNEALAPREPVWWIGHDAVAKATDSQLNS